MKVNFKDNIVLTSQSPHNFLIVDRDGDSGEFYVLPQLIGDVSEGDLYFNGVDINDIDLDYRKGLKLDSTSSTTIDIAPFHITANNLEEFDVDVSIQVYDSSYLDNLVDEWSVNVMNRPCNICRDDLNSFETANKQIEDDTSYLILRSNPKFTGNIKLVIDSQNKVYLDTFKASQLLSQKKYRKRSVSAEDSVLSNDIRSVFSDLPRGELYKIGREDLLDVTVPKTDYSQQYDFDYNYGGRLLQDKLYNESFSMLAPLWINNDLPEYFVIFRVPGPRNEDLDNLSYQYISRGQIVKSWGMKDNTSLGKYLRSHINELTGIRAPTFLSLSDPASDNPDPNTWYGIAVDKGIITSRSETPYFFDQKTDNFTEMNAFISDGFERNNLLCPNLVNMEFEFDDEEAPLYTMNRYFGLYLSENELYRIAYYKETPDSSIEILELGGQDVSSFINSDIFDATTGELESEYENRIFSLNDVNDIIRIKETSDFDGSEPSKVQKWINKAGPNIFSAPAEKKDINPFVNFTINKRLAQGEHLRIINDDETKIWEVYSVDFDYLDKGESWKYASYYKEDGYPHIYRTVFSAKGEISDQIEAINSAFSIFSEYEETPFYTSTQTEDSLSILLKDPDQSGFKFQRITGNFYKNDMWQGESKIDDITLFGYIDLSEDDVEIISYDASFGPINFEFFGDRKSITINFLEQEDRHYYSLDSEYIVNFEDYVYYYSEEEERYKLLKYFEIETEIDRSNLYISDPISKQDKIIVQSNDIISLVGGVFNAYSIYPLTISLMGINPVKDIDYNMYDASLGFRSDQWYKREDDASTYKLSLIPSEEKSIEVPSFYEIYQGNGKLESRDTSTDFNVANDGILEFNTFDSSVLITGGINGCKIRKIEISNEREFTSYKDGASEEERLDYYQDSSASLKYSLTIPYVSKWSLLGSNARGNDLRLILNSNIFESTGGPSTNFIPFSDKDLGESYSDEISNPVFKYINSGDHAWKSYLFYDIYDTIYYDGEPTTVRDLIFEEPYLDVFSKYLYFSNLSDVKIRSSLVYYSDFKNSIDTIYNGLRFSISLKGFATSIFDIQRWNRYRFSFISTPSSNRNSNQPIELIINENTETILMIWYQGSDDLNYSRRQSDDVLPKGLIDNDKSEFSLNGPFNDFALNYFMKSPVLITVNNLIRNAYIKYDKGDIVDPNDIRFESDIVSPLSQFNNHYTGDNEESVYNYFKEAEVNSINQYIDKDPAISSTQFNTFDPSNFVEYGYTPTLGSFDKNLSVNNSFIYNHQDNYYKDKTCSFENLKYIIESNLIQYYIIREDLYYSNSNFALKPILIDINEPRYYVPENLDESEGIYMYNGWYRPVFNDILKFTTNETSEIINTFNKDFVVCNTNLSSHKNLTQLWYNEVVDQITQKDIDRGDAIDYREGFNIFKSSWDSNYYTLNEYDSSGNLIKTPINGYNSSKELPSFFGSRLTKLPDKINLSNWDNINVNLIEREDTYILEYNLTSNMTRIFKENKRFTDNWSFPNSSNLIDKYVKDTILNYYQINYNSIDVNIYTKNLGEDDILSLTNNGHELSEGKNVNGNLVYRDNEYYYQIEVSKNKNLSYFVTFDIYEK